MATSRPATPEVARRLLVDPAVEEAVDVLVRLVVERVVLVATGVSVLVRVDAPVELDVDPVDVDPVVVDPVDVDPVDAVVATVRAVEVAVPGPAADEPVVATVGAVVVGVSGSKVREPAGDVVDPRAGTVTSGTVAAGAATPEPTGARPGTGAAVPTGADREAVGADRSAAPPQAARSTAAMP